MSYEARRNRLCQWMLEEQVQLAMFEHTEGRQDPSIRWLTGHPSDALLFLAADSTGAVQALLVPWDLNLALCYAEVDSIIAYSEFERRPLQALKGALSYFHVPLGSRVEIPPVMPYPLFLRYVEAFMDFEILCRNGGIHEEAEGLRAVKDPQEIQIYRTVSAITNELMEEIEGHIRSGRLATEDAVALYLESACRKRGCEGVGFEILAAGPKRSFGIHPFPAYTAGEFATAGLSILDFGLKYEGYTSDVTLTFARAPLSRAQERLLALTERAYRLALAMVEDGVAAKTIAAAVDGLFAHAKKRMPHALGHGIGLEAHESPLLGNRTDNDWVLKSGMIFTLEPGLYDPTHGGCRLENDILLTESGPEVLTQARIIRL
ncbi:MAG: Xaa-Pro peptidase family protein [Spirochaetaceae bacterium]|jgi:Xaa-Pro dipeptidase|nr:Xaa-Pro peptidase family protein [Spirochaetaceae bacterium]